MNNKNSDKPKSITGILGLMVSLFFGCYTLYQQHSEEYGIDIIVNAFASTFENGAIIYSYVAWGVFLIIYGSLSLCEEKNGNVPHKDDETLVSKNFGYALWWWGIAAVFYQQVALTVESESTSIMLPIVSSSYYIYLVFVSLLMGYWGLHHVVAGRIYINGYWDPHIHKYENHKIINRGIYAHVRHPIYGGQILFTLSIALMWNNWIVMVLPLMTFFANWQRLKTEEKELNIILDGEYDKYKRLTPPCFFSTPSWSRLIDG